jgi:hypothetical protein
VPAPLLDALLDAGADKDEGTGTARAAFGDAVRGAHWRLASTLWGRAVSRGAEATLFSADAERAVEQAAARAAAALSASATATATAVAAAGAASGFAMRLHMLASAEPAFAARSPYAPLASLPAFLVAMHGVYTTPVRTFTVPPGVWLLEASEPGELCYFSMDAALWRAIQPRWRASLVRMLRAGLPALAHSALLPSDIGQRERDALATLHVYPPGSTAPVRQLSLPAKDDPQSGAFRTGTDWDSMDAARALPAVLAAAVAGGTTNMAVAAHVAHTVGPALIVLAACGGLAHGAVHRDAASLAATVRQADLDALGRANVPPTADEAPTFTPLARRGLRASPALSPAPARSPSPSPPPDPAADAEEHFAEEPAADANAFTSANDTAALLMPVNNDTAPSRSPSSRARRTTRRARFQLLDDGATVATAGEPL